MNINGCIDDMDMGAVSAEQLGEDGVAIHDANLKGLTYYNNADDPYITIPPDELAKLDDEEDDINLKEDDCIVLVAHTDQEYSCIEVHVYEEETGNLYVHHDIPLPAFPLCVSWVGYEATSEETGKAHSNFVAVGR